jgi:flagellar hook-associated protein 2
MYLSDFGIATLGYFTAADNEKNAYHIDGDEDDSDTSGNTDKLKSMIASDSSTVISFFTQLSQNLYTKMSDLSKSVDGYRSYGSFYDDKKMSSDYSDYTTKISEMEDKLNDYEDKLYSKYSSMETALAKLQSNSSAVTALLGG